MSEPLEARIDRLSAISTRANGYLARAEMKALIAEIAHDPKRLEPHGFKVYSQSDQDGILEEIFLRLGIENGRFVEIGVENGLECNSLYLIHKGWIGAWIEGDKRQRAAIQEKFASIVDRRLSLAFGWITAENINDVLRRLGADADLDFLSIDVDGNDIYLLEALTSKPKVICIEYNGKFPAALAKQATYDPKRLWRGTDFMGASLKAVARCAGAKGYRLVGTNLVGGDAFFVREDLAGDLFPDDASPENLYNPPRYWLWADHFLNIGHPPDFGPYVDLES